MKEQEAVDIAIDETLKTMKASEHYTHENFTRSTALLAICRFIRHCQQESQNVSNR